jgi:type I restriction enzyme, S subunit
MAFIPGDAGMTSRIVKLGEVAEINPRSGAREFLEPESSVSFVSMSDISDVTFRIENETKKSFESTAKGYTAFERGDVLLAKITPCFENGKLAVADIRHPFGFGSTEFHVIRPRENRIDARFVYHVLRQEKIRIDGERKMTGSAGQRRVPKHFLEDLEILLPPLEVQKRIASILDAADALRAKRRESLRKLEVLLKSVFLEMFGDPFTNPKGWDEIEIGKTAIRFSDGPFGSNLKSEHYQETGIQVIRLQNIGVGEFDDSSKVYVSEKHFQSLPRHHCKPGDVIIGTLGEPNLRACVLPSHIENALNKADCILYRTDPNFVTPEYACNLLNSDGMVSKASLLALGETRLRISMGRLKSLTMPVPPLELQHKFSGVIARFEKEKSDTLASLASLETLFSSLQDQAFNGTLDFTAPQLAQLEVQTSLF